MLEVEANVHLILIMNKSEANQKQNGFVSLQQH